MPKSFDPKRKVHVTAFANGIREDRILHVISEIPLTLYLGDREIITLLTSGQDPQELAVGFFFSEGFFDAREEIAALDFHPDTGICRVQPAKPMDSFTDLFGKRMVTSGCGKGSSFSYVMDSISSGRIQVDSPLAVPPYVITTLAKAIYRPSALYRETHGVHAAALCSKDEILIFREDIGRHNALDKIAGCCLLDGWDRKDTLLFTTGRITSEVMVKAGRLGCPIVVSRSSATALALELAEQIGISVLGGARSSGFHVYTNEQRIRFQDDPPPTD